MVDRLSNRTGNFANSNAISNFIEWQGRGQPLPTMGQQAPAAGPPAQAQAAASPGNGAGRLFYTRGIFGKRGQILGRLDQPEAPGGRAGANPSSSRGADRRTASQKFPRNSGRGSDFFKTAAEGQAGGAASAGRAATLGGESCSSGATSGAISDDRGQNMQARGAGTVKSKHPSAQNPRKCGDQSSGNRRGNREK